MFLFRTSIATALIFFGSAAVATADVQPLIGSSVTTAIEHFKDRKHEVFYITEGENCEVVGYRDNGMAVELVPEHVEKVVAEKFDGHEITFDRVVPERIDTFDHGVVIFARCE